MVSMLVVRDDGTIQRDASQAAVAQAWRDEQQLVWLDFDHPSNTEEQQFLIDLLDFNEGAIEHVTEPQKGPRSCSLSLLRAGGPPRRRPFFGERP